MTQDDTRVNFLLALDRSDAVELHGFEAEFVESNLAAFSFSPKQRVIIDRLIAKYEDKINWNPNRNRLAERACALVPSQSGALLDGPDATAYVLAHPGEFNPAQVDQAQLKQDIEAFSKISAPDRTMMLARHHREEA